MHKAEKRIAALERSLPDRKPASRPRRRRDESQLFEGIEEARKRRERWLDAATTAQLESRLRRIDNVEGARKRRDERDIEAGYTGAVGFAGLTEVWADSDREEVAKRLFADARIEIIYPDLRELVKKARQATMGGSIAAAVLAAVKERVDAKAA